MAYSTYTLEQAREMLSLWIDCEKQLALGQAKEYQIGSRIFKAVDLDEIRKSIRYWEEQVATLDGTRSAKSVKSVIFRDV